MKKLQESYKSSGRRPIVALVTDFGCSDSYVFELNLLCHQRHPELDVFSITNDIVSGNIAGGAYIIERASRSLQDGDVVLGIVDPGVGGRRQGIAVKSRGLLFVGPDNGLFARAIDWDSMSDVRILDRGGISTISDTFHGRDLFLPAALRLASGWPINEIGLPGQLQHTRPPLRPIRMDDRWFGRIIHIDRFGNLISDISDQASGRLLTKNGMSLSRFQCYDAIPSGQAGWLVGSDTRIEIAMNGHSAADYLGMKIGDSVMHQDVR